MQPEKTTAETALDAVKIYLHYARGALRIGNFAVALNTLSGHVVGYLGTAMSALNLHDDCLKPLQGLVHAYQNQALLFNFRGHERRMRHAQSLPAIPPELTSHAPGFFAEYSEMMTELSVVAEPATIATITLRPLNDALVIAEDPFRSARDKLLPLIAALTPMPGEILVEQEDAEPVAAGASAGKRNGHGK